MKTLIFGGCFCDLELKRDVVTLWARLLRHLNPDLDIALWDSASPIDPTEFLPKSLHIDVHRFETNIGHLSQGGGDGAGRTFMTGIGYAIDHEYDYVVHVGTDMFFAKPISEVVSRIHRANIKCAALPLLQFQFHEWELSAFNCEWARDIDFVGKYNWQREVANPETLYDIPKSMPEFRQEHIAGDDLWILPYTGIRNDESQNLNYVNLHNRFPYEPPTWLHMVRDIREVWRFLHLNQIELP